jgi:hypothetical protein
VRDLEEQREANRAVERWRTEMEADTQRGIAVKEQRIAQRRPEALAQLRS